MGKAENQPLKKESHALHGFRKKAVIFPLVRVVLQDLRENGVDTLVLTVNKQY